MSSSDSDDGGGTPAQTGGDAGAGAGASSRSGAATASGSGSGSGSNSRGRRLQIAFLHPDLGLGGAERLVVDAMQALLNKRHHVTMYTSYYNPSRCFEETTKPGFRVRVYGSHIPRHMFGFLHILWANVRNAYLAACVCLREPAYQLFVCDQVSICHLVIRLLQPSAKILFYCHYPDQLLSDRSSLLKRLYRLPFDLTEEVTTGLADVIVCNSKFSRSVFRDTFRLLRHVSPGVLHPCVDLDSIKSAGPPSCYDHGHVVFLSINRFERKKNIALAVLAMATLRDRLDAKTFARVHLVVAGGYDRRVQENVEYYQHLMELAQAQRLLGEEESVSFVRSFTDTEKVRMLQMAVAVLYTPDKEHFGIVPLECMAAARPVVAVASGGPLETVVHEETGFLCEPTPESFADAMERLVKDPDMVVRMGNKARAHVQDNFSRAAFGDKLERLCTGIDSGDVPTMGGAGDASTSSPLPPRRCGAALLCLALLLLLAASLAVAFFGGRAALRVGLAVLSPPSLDNGGVASPDLDDV